MTFEFISVHMTGETNDKNINALRSRQMKNFHLALMISQVIYLKAIFMCHVNYLHVLSCPFNLVIVHKDCCKLILFSCCVHLVTSLLYASYGLLRNVTFEI